MATGEDLEYWQAPNLAEMDGVIHAFTTRKGGVSAPPYATLNMGFHTGDEAAAVAANRRRFLEALGIPLENVIGAEQVHGGGVARVGKGERGRGARDRESAIAGVDALVTADPGSLLLLCFADCLPVFLVDRRRRAVALAHAGWRGSVAGVSEATVAELGRLGVEASDLVAALGPCIKPCCYEVSPELARRFAARFGEEAVGRTGWGAPSIDLAEANRLSLLRLGIPEASIFVEQACTACRTDLYYSHRFEGGTTGRMAAVLALRPGLRVAGCGFG